MRTEVPQDDRAVAAAAAELPALTGLRGLAALTVLLYHSSWVAAKFAGGAPPGVWRRGYLAVDLFFFLSGFVLTHVYGRRFAARHNWRAIGNFIWARFSRVYPTSVFAAAVCILPVGLGRIVWSTGVSFQDQLFAALFLMQVPWLRDVVINSPSWSISAEFYAYLLFPLIVPFILQLRGHRVVLVGTALILGIVVNHLVNSHNQTTQGWGALLRALPEFAAGIFAYRVYAERLFRTFLEKDVSLAGIAAVIIAVCIANASDGVVVPLLLLLLLAAVCNSGRMAGYLNLRPLRWLGEVSYSVYIFQIPSLTLAVGFSGTLIAHGLGGTRFIALAAALALAAGVLVHRCVDVPARAALRRLPSRVAAFAIAYSGNHDLSAHPGAGATVAPRSAGSPAKEKRQ